MEHYNDACDHSNDKEKHQIHNRGTVLCDVSAGGRITMEHVIL